MASMTDKMSRREFVVTTTAGVAAAAGLPRHSDAVQAAGLPRHSDAVAAAGQGTGTKTEAPAIMKQPSAKPVVVASANGHQFKNGGAATAVEQAFSMMTSGRDVLESLIAGVTIVELDPEETSVGYGGLPNAEGVVQLDSCCMHGPLHRAGGVAAIEGVRTPAQVAYKVMQETDNHLLAGKGAQEFARRMGFTIEDDLNTERSRKTWLEWKRRTDAASYLDPIKREAAQRKIELDMIAEGWIAANHFYGTINCNGVNAKGEVCGVTTTSGRAWKIPGRVGDSPILGAGLYVDNEVGAAGSTGRGEANLYNLTSYLIVEHMRRGLSPKDAGIEALKRIKANTVEKRLRRSNGDPNFDIKFYIMNARGEHAGVTMYGGQDATYAICDEKGARIVPMEPFLSGSATD